VKPAVVSLACLTDDALNRSMLAEIQRNIIKKGERNTVSRLFHANNDKGTITTWKSDLSRILLVFNVRFAVVVWLSLTLHSQTELALNTHTIISGMGYNVTKIHAIVSNIDSTVMRIQEETDGKNLPVSILRVLHLSPDERSPLPRLESGQRSRLRMGPASDICIQRVRGIPTTATGRLLWTRQVD
jgi:hypothetical protein